MDRTGTNALASEGRFRVRCEAAPASRFSADTDLVRVAVSQRIRHHDRQGIWDSVVVEGKAEQDGTLVVRVFVSNPDWEERLQIACIRSRPDDPECLTALGTNLDFLPT